MAAHLSGQSWAVLAASEMGKGVWLKQELKRLKPQKLLIWDTNDEYDAIAEEIGSLSVLLAAVINRSAYRLRYVPKSKTDKELRAEFELWCSIVYQAKHAVIVVEELADVTSASHAPPAWRKLNTRGRHHQGLTLYWCSQSPAAVDKFSMGNATHMHVGYLGEPRHRQATAAHMGCHADEIDALKQFDYIEYVKATKERKKGRVKLSSRKV